MSETFGVGAAFDAFKNRGRGGVLTGAAIGWGIGTIILIGAFVAVAWSSILSFGTAYYTFITAALAGGPPPDPNDPAFMALMQAMAGLAGFGFIFIFFVYLLLASFEAAIHRWLVRGETGAGLLGLNLGADTWRVYFCYWVWFFVYVGLSIGVSLAGALIAGVLGAALTSAQVGEGLVIGVTTAVIVVFYLAMLYVLIRLAPATAVTVGLKRFSYFKAWTATRGRFWPMLGAYLLLAIVYFIGYCVLLAVGFGVALGPVMGSFAQGAPPDAETFFAALMQPTTLAILGVLYLVLFAMGMVFYIAFMGINAAAARVAIAEGRLGAPPAAPQPAVS